MKKIILVLSAMLAFLACQKSGNTGGTITLNTPEDVTVPTGGSICEVEFVATGDWTASLSVRDWATVNRNFGTAGTFVLKVPFLSNEDEEEAYREAVLTIQSGDDVRTVTFHQLQKDGIHIGNPSVSTDFLNQSVTLKVYSNVALTVSTNQDWVKGAVTKAVSESEYVFNLEMNKTDETRSAAVTFKGGDAEAVAVISQTAFDPQISFGGVDENNTVTLPFIAGSAAVTVASNLEYEVLPLEEGLEEWFSYTRDGDEFTFTVTENESVGSRSAYMDFRFPDYEIEGEPYVARVTVIQTGTLEVVYSVDLPAEIAGGRFSIAKLGDKLLVCNSSAVYVFTAATGEYAGVMELGGTVPTGITNDDAGNVVMSLGGDWDADLLVCAVHSTASSLADTLHLIDRYHHDTFYGYGLNNIRVTGDVASKAAITLISGGPKDYGCADYAVSWQVEAGSVAGSGASYTDYVTLPEAGDNVWSSYSIVAMHSTDDISSGMFYAGYDGLYNLYYNPGMSSSGWTEVLQTGSSWAEGYNAMDAVEWNGHKYLGFIGMGYFPTYAMPSYQWLVNVDDPAAPATIATLSYLGSGDGSIDSSDCHLEVNGKDLDYYVIDGPQYVLRLVRFLGKSGE